MVAKQVNRIEWIDIAKGIGIFLMVIGHTGIPQYLSNWIYSFHMPMFFVLSGILYNHEKYKSFRALLKARLYSLCIPYLVFTVVAFVGMRALGLVEWVELYKGWSGYALWFIPVLLMTELAYNRICHLMLRLNFATGVIFLLLLCIYTGYLVSLEGVHLYYKIEVVLFAIFFFGCGHQFSERIRRASVPIYVFFLLLTIQIFLSQRFSSVDMADNYYGSMPISILVCLNGSLVVYLAAKYLSAVNKKNYIRRFGEWAGRNTITILGLSQVVYMAEKQMMSHMAVNASLSFIIRQALLWLILFGCSMFLNKYLPTIIGKR